MCVCVRACVRACVRVRACERERHTHTHTHISGTIAANTHCEQTGHHHHCRQSQPALTQTRSSRRVAVPGPAHDCKVRMPDGGVTKQSRRERQAGSGGGGSAECQSVQQCRARGIKDRRQPGGPASLSWEGSGGRFASAGRGTGMEEREGGMEEECT